MPIYAYRCDACGFEKDVLQKLSDPALTACPTCGKESFSKKLTAPNFQLKGTGWYVTDFRDNGKKPAEGADGAPAVKPVSGGDAKSGDSAASPAPAAAPAAAPAPAAAAPAPSPSSSGGAKPA